MPRTAKRKGPSDLVGEQHLRLLVDAARDYAIFTLDGEGRVLTWNSGAQEIQRLRGAGDPRRTFFVFL